MVGRGARDALAVPLLYLAGAVAWLLSAPPGPRALLVLAAGYPLALLLVSLLRGHADWRRLLVFLALLCPVLALPFWAELEVTGSLRLSPAFMQAGGPLLLGLLWMVPLFPLLLSASRGGLARLALLAPVVFALWCWGGEQLGLWHYPGLLRGGPLPLAPVLSSTALALLAAQAWRRSGRGLGAQLVAALNLGLQAAGLVLLTLLLVEYIFRSALLRIL